MCDICDALGQVVDDDGTVRRVGPADEALALRLILERGQVFDVPSGGRVPPAGTRTGPAGRKGRRGRGRRG